MLKAQKPVLIQRLDTFRKKLEKHRKEVEATLQKHLDSSRQQIVDYYVPRIIESPPDALQGQLITKTPTKSDASQWLETELDRVFPSAGSLIDAMRLEERFKDVTFETLNREDFLKSVKVAFPLIDWDKAYAEFRAAGEERVSKAPETTEVTS